MRYHYNETEKPLKSQPKISAHDMTQHAVNYLTEAKSNVVDKNDDDEK